MTADEILALAGVPRALDVTPEQRAERRMAERLAAAGVTVGMQKEGGRVRARWRVARREIRLIVIEGLLFNEDSSIPARLRRRPAGTATIEALLDYLRLATLEVSERTLRADVAEIGKRRREKSMH